MTAIDTQPLLRESLTALASRFGRRELAPSELMRAVLEYADRVNPLLNAIVTFRADEALAELPSVVSVRRDQEAYCLAVNEVHVALPALLERTRQLALPLARLTTRHASLEDVFVTLTGRHLREEQP